MKTKKNNKLAKVGIASTLAIVTTGTVVYTYIKKKQIDRVTKKYQKLFSYYLENNLKNFNVISHDGFKESSVRGFKHMRFLIDKHIPVDFSIRNFDDINFTIRFNKNILPASSFKKSFDWEEQNITSRDYNIFSDMAYYVDEVKANKDNIEPVKVGDILLIDFSRKYEVIKVLDNKVNGLQAMAVKFNNHIVIVYAGTNIEDSLDILADADSIVLQGALSKIFTQEAMDNQESGAELFFKEVRIENESCDFSFTGHSLGGFLGLAVASENRYPAQVFNAPDPYAILSESAKIWLKNNRDKCINFRNSYDTIGNFGGNKTETQKLIKLGEGLDPLVYHGIATWEFDKDGNIIDKI